MLGILVSKLPGFEPADVHGYGAKNGHICGNLLKAERVIRIL